jgi:hypothetical protein
VEDWEAIPTYPEYEASTEGRIRRARAGQGATANHILKPYINEHGYAVVDLYHNGTRYRQKVHELVAEAFLPGALENPSLPINHVNGNREDNRVRNLEVVSAAENVARDVIRRQKAGTYVNPSSRLSNEDHKEIRTLYYKEGYTQDEIADMFGVGQSTVSNILRKQGRS